MRALILSTAVVMAVASIASATENGLASPIYKLRVANNTCTCTMSNGGTCSVTGTSNGEQCFCTVADTDNVQGLTKRCGRR
jgi:hypothetical protein